MKQSHRDFDIVNMENVYTTVKPFYYLAKTLGLFPKSFDVKGKFETKWHGIMGSLLSLSTASVLLILNLLINDGPTSSSVMLSEMLRVQAVIGIILIIIQFFYQHSKVCEIVEFIDLLNKIDQKVMFN